MCTQHKVGYYGFECVGVLNKSNDFYNAKHDFISLYIAMN